MYLLSSIKKSLIFLVILIPLEVFSQVNDNFTDGDFTNNPVWGGIVGNFKINSELQLQSSAATTSKSYLSTPSEAFDNAVWEFWVKINYTTSSSNYASVYLVSDRSDFSSECFGYYVQIGNTNDEISLYRQEGTKKTKIIDGTDKLIDINPVEVRIKVTRDKNGVFSLFRKLPTDVNYVQEGEDATDNNVLGSKFFGVLYANSSTTGNAYFFDDIKVTGVKLLDEIAPIWTNIAIIASNKLLLNFSEPIDFNSAEFNVDNGIGKPSVISISSDKYSVELTFSQHFERGKIYTINVLNVKDFAGNLLENTQKQTGIIEKIDVGDLVINEILFEAPDNVPEYLEIFNLSDKILDVSNVSFGVRKADKTFSPVNFLPMKTIILPKKYLAITTDADTIKKYYQVPDTANIIHVSKWSALNNSGASLLIANATGDTIYDEVTYNAKWHHPLIKITKGVSLERINPLLPSQDPASWHSAASDIHYGTPGYKNSQWRDIISENSFKQIWIEPEIFTPDNDGNDDICFIRYQTESNGFIANVTIFNPNGVKIKQVASNQLLSTKGFFTWDGQTEKGQNVNPGIYVLYFEMINTQSGVKKIEKRPIVVSAR